MEVMAILFLSLLLTLFLPVGNQRSRKRRACAVSACRLLGIGALCFLTSILLAQFPRFWLIALLPALVGACCLLVSGLSLIVAVVYLLFERQLEGSGEYTQNDLGFRRVS